MLERRYRRWIGWLLMAANSACSGDKEWFYPLKDRVLSRYGTVVGYHLQHVQKSCYTCDGSGWIVLWDLPCDRCQGGIYEEFWTTLEVVQVGRFRFHRPLKRYWDANRLPLWAQMRRPHPDIQGIVRHRPHPAANEAKLWLLLLFDRPRFWSELKSRSTQCQGLLSTLQRVVFWAWVAVPYRCRVRWRRWRDWCDRHKDDPFDDIPF